MIQLNYKNIEKDYISFDITNDNKNVFIIQRTNNTQINVIVNNASHKVGRGLGKTFNSIEEAVNNYKCPKIKSIIQSISHL
jgi:short-subunit dehydrogenase